VKRARHRALPFALTPKHFAQCALELAWERKGASAGALRRARGDGRAPDDK
jgi:hypothetical protein